MLQKIAQEMNLSNTGFILEKNSQDTYSQGKQTRNTIQLLIGIKRAECSRLKYYQPTCTPG